MKSIAKYLSVALLFSNSITPSCSTASSCCATTPTTVFIPISQGQNLYTQYHKPMYLAEEECWAVDFSATYRFQQTRGGGCCNNIATSLFQYNPLTFVGLAANPGQTVRAPNELVPEYFGLASDTNTQVSLSPRIRNNIIDLQLALGGERLWFQVNVPVVKTNWQINKGCTPTANVGKLPLEELSTFYMTTGGAAGAYQIGSTASNAADNTGWGTLAQVEAGTPTTLLNVALNDTVGVSDVFTATNDIITVGKWNIPTFDGGTPFPPENTNAVAYPFELETPEVLPAESIAEALGTPGFNFGNITGRTYNLMNFGNCTSKWGVADVIAQLGWDFCKSECRHFAVYLRAVFPTGTKLNSCWAEQGVFAPIIGNGKHFELGGGINAHTTFWEGDESDFTAFLDAYVTHMFSTSTFRSFDLPNLPMSRYALVKGFNLVNDVYIPTGIIKALGDVNTATINTSCAARSEIVLDLIYSSCNWKFGVGYAFSGQSAESSSCCSTSSSCCDDSSSAGQSFGFKGLTNNGQLKYLAQGSGTGAAPTFNAATAIVVPGATTNVGGYIFNLGQTATAALKTSGAYKYGIDADADLSIAANVFTLPDLENTCSGLMGGQILNRVFAHIDYVWKDSCWQPELGILGSVGFGSGSYTTAQYWDLGARLGFAF